MNSKVYKSCGVPLCKNTSIKTPDKVFIYVPNKKTIRAKWLKLARREHSGGNVNTPMYFCEDHFDLPNDMENYMQYHVMGSVAQVRMVPGCVPTKFECQPDRRRKTSKTVTRPNILKKSKTIEKQEKNAKRKRLPTKYILGDTSSESSVLRTSSFNPVESPGLTNTQEQTENEQVYDVSIVKQEPPAQFCRGCFSVDRLLAPLGDLLDLFCSLLENPDSPMQPVYLCWECQARLRRVGEFKANVSTVQAFLYEYQCDQDLPVPPMLSRLSIGSTSNEAIESEAKPAEPILMGPAEVEVKHEPPPSPEYFFTAEIEIKPEIKDDDPESEEQTLQPEDPDSNDSLWVPERPPKSRKGPKRNNLKYVHIDNTNLCLEKFYRKVPINNSELSVLLEQERNDELFLRYPYRCETCVRGWRRETALLTHNSKRHSVSSPYECDICSARMASKQRLSFHIKGHYYARQCTACEYRCASLGAMRRHVLGRHHKTVQCRTCESCFHDPRSFHRHYRALHQFFECDHCGKRRKSRTAIERHLARHGPFSCRQCPGLQLATRGALAQHHTRRHDPRERAPELAYCVECDKQFTTVACYKAHLAETKVHKDSGRSRPACPACGKTFARAAYMRAHYDFVHLAKSKYKCNQCDKSFCDSSYYHYHMRRHQPGYAPPRDKLCTVCGRGFSTNFHLSNHIRTHTGERPFACAQCDAKFGAAVALRAHVNFVHLKHKRKQTQRANRN